VAQADVLVVGLGSMGAAAAYHLAHRGHSVLGVDRFAPPHDRGAHAGGSRIIRMAYLEGAEYVPLVRRSYDLWSELEAETGESLLTRTGGLMLGPADSKAVGGALSSARVHDLAHELLDPDQLRRRFPQFSPGDDEVGLFEEVAGLVRPEAAIAAHLRLAAAAGATVRSGVAVRGWETTAAGVRVHTDDGPLDADRLVIAPGAWAGDLVRLPVPLRVERRVQHYWRPTGPVEDFAPGRLPVWIWEYAAGAMAYGLPDLGGGVKASLHHGPDPVDPSVGAAPPTDGEIAAMRDWLQSRMPRLAAGEWVSAKPCLYTLTPDEHFVIGRHPEHPAVAVAYGFSGHGFKFSPVVGEILADLTESGVTSHPIDLFAPARPRMWPAPDSGTG
jgi:sarcosine oxidase